MIFLHANIDVHSRRLTAKFQGDGVTYISKLQYHCENMDFVKKSIDDKMFQQVTHIGGDSSMNYTKRFQNEQALSFSVGNIYAEHHLVNIFLNIFFQGGKYTIQIASHQAELKRQMILLTKIIYLFHLYRPLI